MLLQLSTVLSLTSLISLSCAAECWNRGYDLGTRVKLHDLQAYGPKWCNKYSQVLSGNWTDPTLHSGTIHVGKIGTFANVAQCTTAWNDILTCYPRTTDAAGNVNLGHGGGGWTDSYYSEGGSIEGVSLEVIFGPWPEPITTASTPSSSWKGW